MSKETHYLYTELSNKLREDADLFDWFELGATDGLWYWDLTDPEQEWLSPQFKRVFGYKNDEIPHTSAWWQENIFPEDLPGVLDNFEKHKADPNHPYDQVVRYRHKDGHTVWIRCRGLIIRDENNQPTRMLGAHTDLTELMRAREQLVAIGKELEASLEDVSETNKVVLETAGIGIWLWDLTTDQIIWDDTMLELYQLDTDGQALQYEHWRGAVHPDDIEDIEQRMQAAIKGERFFRTEIRVPLRDGSIRYIKSAAEIFYNEAGEPLRMRGANWDITEEKLREQELERSNRDLERFAYVASHDLKAPLRGIRQLASWIEEDLPDPPESVKSHISMMNKRVARLEHLLEDILTYSRSGSETNNPTEEVNFDSLIREIFESLCPDRTLTLNITSIPPQRVPSPTKLSQVLQNMLSNAIKHKGDSSEHLLVTTAVDKGRVVIEVMDQNPQIPEEYRQRIFEMFQTLRPRDQVEGSGMGLAIAERIVNSMGGSLSYHPAPVDQKTANIRYSNVFSFTWPHENT